MPAAIPIAMGAISVGGSIFNGINGASAAKKAGQIQQDEDNRAAQRTLDTTNTVNPAIGAAHTTAGNQVVDASGAAGNKVVDAGNVAGQGVTTTTGQANELLDPYIQSGKDANGTLQTGLAAGGDFNRNFNLNDFQVNDPGYAFRMAEAQKALERGQAARGGGMGGGAAKELARYSQNFASGEFQNAFSRFETQNNDRFSRLNTVAGRGFAAAGESGTNSINASKYAGDMNVNTAVTAGGWNVDASKYKGAADMSAADLMARNSIDATRTANDYTTDGAAARAAGVVGRSNAITGAVAAGGKGVNSVLAHYLKNPAQKKEDQ